MDQPLTAHSVPLLANYLSRRCRRSICGGAEVAARSAGIYHLAALGVAVVAPAVAPKNEETTPPSGRGFLFSTRLVYPA